MGIDYKAMLFYGFELTDEMLLRMDLFDYDFDALASNALGIDRNSPEYKQQIEQMHLSWTSVYWFEESSYYVVLKGTFKVAEYTPITFAEMPQIDADAVASLEHGCAKLGIPFMPLRWYLCLEAF